MFTGRTDKSLSTFATPSEDLVRMVSGKYQPQRPIQALTCFISIDGSIDKGLQLLCNQWTRH